MATSLAPAFAPGIPSLTILTLQPDDVEHLRLPGKRSSEEMRNVLAEHWGRSVWTPSTLEYALLRPWRNRPEIASIDELVAIRHTEPLLQAAFERCVAHGDELMLAIELESEHVRSRFERAGLEMLEEVITFDAQIPRSLPSPPRGVRLVPIGVHDDTLVDLIAEVDETAFPWLWRNSRTEFDVYLRTPGVQVSLVEERGEPVGYVGLTLFSGWGHLDRIAITPYRQGRGLGRDALALAIAAMRQRGARRVALSTQRLNWRSQRLYERFGFHRTYDHDYRLFGRWCDLNQSAAYQSRETSYA
ncbi:MAG: GNAT family N-acetyltransferase [Chloroflexia bacterium]|nr:GNAT family N-acetyltransferase [Chloroflexia bacterium]